MSVLLVKLSQMARSPNDPLCTGSDEDYWLSVTESLGEIMVNRRLDFDTMNHKVRNCGVLVRHGEQMSTACCSDRWRVA